MHAVAGAEQGHAEFLVRQCAQSPAVFFATLDGAVREVGEEILVLDFPPDAVGLFDSKRVRPGRHCSDGKNHGNDHGLIF